MFNEITAKIAKFVGDVTPRTGQSRVSSLPRTLTEVPHFVHQLLPYESYDRDAMLYINKQSVGFVMELTTLIGSNNETENILASIITDILPLNADLQFLFWASPKIGEKLQQFENARSINPLFARLARFRTEYLSKGVQDSLTRDGTVLLRDFRLFLSISIPKKIKDVSLELVRIRDDIANSCKSIGMYSRSIECSEFISLLSDMLLPNTSNMPRHIEWNPYDPISIQIADPEYKLSVSPDGLTFEGLSGPIEVRCLTVREYPQSSTLWKISENLGQLFNSNLQVPCPFMVSFSIRKVDRERAQIDRHKTQIGSTTASQNRDLQLIGNECLVKTFHQVILFTSPDKASGCERRIRDLFNANGWRLARERFLQMQSWLALLPMSMSEGLFDDLKNYGRLKTITAFNAVTVSPLQGEWRGSKTASLFLPGRRGQVTLWNPFDNESGNYNMTIIAAPGKGKSAFTQEYIVSVLGGGGRVWVIDVGRSYEKSCKLLNGQFIEFDPSTQICLNPFTHVRDINEAMVMLKPLIASMARPVRGATEEELSYLEQAIKMAWEQRGKLARISTVSQWLNQQEDPICKNLSHLLFSYSIGGVYAQFFEGDCNIDFENNYIVMELQELKAKKDLQRVVLQVLIFLISQKMYLTGRTQIKSCIIDESYSLLDSDDVSTAKFIETGCRTARKFRGNFVSIAHSIADFHRNAMARAAYDCSDYQIILGQTDEAINKLKHEKIMELDGFTERLLKSLRLTRDYSECVIKGPNGISVHRIIFDPYSRILYSTKGEEFDAVNRLVAQGLPLIEAISEVARRFNYV